MQKISSYLYSNRIAINLDLASSPLEWRIVYQRKVKIYKGFNNVIELDIKNSEQKRIDVSDKTLKCVVMDTFGQSIYTADVVHASTPGLATFTIPADDLAILDPQFLRYTVYIENEDLTKSPIYGDTQFGVTGMMDLIGNALPQALPVKTIKTFTYLHDTVTSVKTYYSEAAEVNPPNDIVADPEVSLDIYATGLSATVRVQITEDPVVSTATNWTTIDTFAISPVDTLLSKNYGALSSYTKDKVWMRLTYVRADANTGKIDKVLVSL